jgi:hypothetical protein
MLRPRNPNLDKNMLCKRGGHKEQNEGLPTQSRCMEIHGRGSSSGRRRKQSDEKYPGSGGFPRVREGHEHASGSRRGAQKLLPEQDAARDSANGVDEESLLL